MPFPLMIWQPKYPWQRAVLDSLLWPADRHNLLAAETAITRRLLLPDRLAKDERAALRNALLALRELVRPLCPPSLH
jgi:hypothetical protein